MKMIIIEGNIGSGKSTLTKNLCEALNARAFYEPVESNPYLELFYNDPKKYALPMQFYLMSRRYEMHLEGIDHIWKTGQTCIFDRSIYGDYVFAKKNWLDGNMSELDFDNYNKMREVMFKNLMVPHVTVFLNTDPKINQNRITLRNRDYEKSIPYQYLAGLNELYKDLMYELKNKGSKVIDVDWNEFRPTDYILNKL